MKNEWLDKKVDHVNYCFTEWVRTCKDLPHQDFFDFKKVYFDIVKMEYPKDNLDNWQENATEVALIADKVIYDLFIKMADDRP